MADTGAEDTTTRPVVILGMFVKQKTDLVLLIGFWLRPVVLSAGFLALSGASCDPCVQLTNSICDCEPTANAQLHADRRESCNAVNEMKVLQTKKFALAPWKHVLVLPWKIMTGKRAACHEIRYPIQKTFLRGQTRNERFSEQTKTTFSQTGL